MGTSGWWRWFLGLTIGLSLVVLPYVYYRWNYETSRRLRTVVEGKFYRCGCLTAEGFKRAIQQYGIRTVINLMEEAPDPELRNSYFGSGTIRESDLCRELRVKFIFLEVETIERSRIREDRPATIDRFLALLDDPSSYPVLLHCKAGLHRTGVLAAVYRMEYQGWSREQAWWELRENGFGDHNCYSDNDYVQQYIMAYRPGIRRQALRDGSAAVR